MSDNDFAPSEAQSAISADDELDLSSAGLQPTETVWLITKAEVEPTDNGTRAVVEFEGEVGEVKDFAVTERFWLKHENVKAQQIGLGQLKRLFLAVFGQPTGSVSALQGQYVLATVREDDNGFRRIGRYKTAESAGKQDSAADAAAAAQL